MANIATVLSKCGPEGNKTVTNPISNNIRRRIRKQWKKQEIL